MFTQQDIVPEMPRDPNFPRGPLKRYHQDELSADLANGATMGFTEHRNKRLHTLPLRTSPTAYKWQSAASSSTQPVAITPPSSFHENILPLHADQQHFPITPSAVGPVDMDMDMAMDDTEAPAQGPPCSSRHLEPGPSQPDVIETTLASRVPTPLQPSFAVQVRGSSWGGAAGNAVQSGIASELAHPVLEAASDRSVPRSLDHSAAMGDWSMVQNRSLPSPISESGGEDLATPDMLLDSMAMHGNNSRGRTGHAADDCPHGTLMSTPARPSVAPASLSPEYLGSSPASMDTDLTATPSPKKGHTRSRHTIVAWTQQPGMKKSFSIGYRSDCEKCRNRVPGHFNHIIVS